MVRRSHTVNFRSTPGIRVRARAVLSKSLSRGESLISSTAALNFRYTSWAVSLGDRWSLKMESGASELISFLAVMQNWMSSPREYTF